MIVATWKPLLHVDTPALEVIGSCRTPRQRQNHEARVYDTSLRDQYNLNSFMCYVMEYTYYVYDQ